MFVLFLFVMYFLGFLMKKVNFGIYCVVLGLCLSTATLPMENDSLGAIARKDFNSSRSTRRNITYLNGMLSRIDALKQTDNSEAFAIEAAKVATPIQRRLERSQKHLSMNFKAGVSTEQYN